MPLLVVGLLLFWLWAIYDVVTVDQNQVRNLPKVLWLVLVVVLWALGAALWVFLGRPAQTAPVSRPGTPRRARRAPEPEPETDRHANRVVTDRRSAELDRMLEEWERSRRGDGKSES
jgi:type VI protein secretion system component VasK